jgi:polyisoprenoid-binding protein YceI
MKIICVLVLVGAMTLQLSAQKYFTRDGKISFSSAAPLENIEAVNNKVSSILNVETGEMEFAVLIKSFHFEKALMEEHFNENYMESTKYPKAIFKGKISNLSDVNFTANGSCRVSISGDMTIHGVTKPLETSGMINVSNGDIHATSDFDITVADYNIEIPKVVRDNIAKIVQVHVEIQYKPLEQ